MALPEPSSDRDVARPGAGWRSLRPRDWRPWQVLAVVAIAAMTRGAGAFVFDAHAYWEAAASLFTGGAEQKYFDLRGVFTAVTFAPAALVTFLAGPGIAGFAVLVQNSLLIGWSAGFLVPAVLRPWRLISTRARWVAAGLSWLALGGFAPYPLMDLYAAVAVMGAVALLPRPSRWPLLAAGGLLAYAINLRPAYAAVVVLFALVTCVVWRWRALWAAAGLLIGLLPQIAYNYLYHHRLSPVPISTGDLVALQAGAASFIVRYDTVPWSGTQPQQFFCSPSMASSLDPIPTTTGELLGFFVKNLPQSALFAMEKAAAALHWSFSIPYLSPRPGVDAVFAVAITFLTVLGIVYLVGMPIARRNVADRTLWGGWGLAVALAVGEVLTLVGSAPEARFALPLVLLAVSGVACLSDAGLGFIGRRRLTTVAVVLVSVAVIAVGYRGLAHPAPPGGTDRTICAHA